MRHAAISAPYSVISGLVFPHGWEKLGNQLKTRPSTLRHSHGAPNTPIMATSVLYLNCRPKAPPSLQAKVTVPLGYFSRASPHESDDVRGNWLPEKARRTVQPDQGVISLAATSETVGHWHLLVQNMAGSLDHVFRN